MQFGVPKYYFTHNTNLFYTSVDFNVPPKAKKYISVASKRENDMYVLLLQINNGGFASGL